jgi:ABC-type multidrug transport system fused ATPase/permease subunit
MLLLSDFPTCTYITPFIRNALADVDLERFVSSLPDQLDHQVAEGGEGFSTGQKQLMCIGRVLLRRPKIIILDEATASMDVKTDQFIQNVLRQSFASSTVLKIAHRLETLVNCDRLVNSRSILLACLVSF